MTGSQGGGGEARPMTSVSGKILTKAFQTTFQFNSNSLSKLSNISDTNNHYFNMEFCWLGAGYHGSSKDTGSRAFDPLNIGKGPAPPLAEKSENSHEDKAKEMEKVCIVICVSLRQYDYWFASIDLICSRFMSVSRGGHRLVSRIFILIFTWTLAMILLAFVHNYAYSFTYAYEFVS